MIGDQADRLAAARVLGATTTIPLATTTVEERRSSVLALTDGRGAEVVIECAGRIEAFDEGMGLLAMRAATSCSESTGARDRPARPGTAQQPQPGGHRVNGADDVTDYRTTIQLARRFGERLRLAELVTHRFGLTQLEEAIDVARRGEAIKAVVASSPFR